MGKHVFAALALVSCATFSFAADPQADAFHRIYMGACVQYAGDQNVLRNKLRGAPQLPAEKAALFLKGFSAGTAYPVPDKNGTFVVALPSDSNVCALFARRLDAVAAEENFLKVARNAPPPYSAKLVSEESAVTGNGPTKTITYEWQAVGALRKIVLTFTTATSETADLQGMASVATVP